MSLYEALAGRPALNHLTTFTELVLWLTMEDIPHLQEAAPWIEPQLATIVHAALLREPDDRCPTVDAFLAALEPHAGGGSALTPFMLKGPPPESQGYRALRASYPTSWKTALASLVETAGATGGLQVTGRSGGVDGQSLVGQVLGGRYRLEKLLGKGGMGAVYECVDEKDPARQHHAIKVVLGAEPNADAMRRFVREARAAMSIQSEHVVRVIDADTDSDRGTPFIVMELLHGEDLDQLVKQHGALEPSAAARVFIEAARGLATAHEMGVVHRDIKPANIFLHELPGGQIVVKICDFGVAKQTSLDTSQTSELTHTGGIIGSPMFMSPEQAKSAKHVDHRTDIWSLSISMYQALAGQKPWDSGGALGELIIAICTQDLTPLQDVAPWVSPTLADVIHRGIQRNPAERYAQISELAAALEPFALPAEKLDRAALINLTESRRSLVAERATGLGASRSRSTTMSSLRELESSMSRSMASQVQAPPAPARPVWVPVAAAAVVALGVVGGALALRGSGGATGASSAATAVTSGPVASQTASASAPASIASIAPAVAPRITGRLVVKPSTARVTVNGEPRELTRQGEVLLEGAAGDLFEVAADTGKARSEMRVTLSRDGTVSPGVLVVVGALVGPGLPLGKPTTSPGKTPVTTPTDTPVTPKPRETF
jgi:serine/threonine-protein kinase